MLKKIGKNIHVILLLALLAIGALTGNDAWSYAGIGFAFGAGVAYFQAAWLIGRQIRGER